MGNRIVLRVENLNVQIENKVILENLSFEVKEGEVLTILGPNGAGKTVLLKTLLKLLPFKGKIEWKEDVKISYVPQRLPFIKDIPMDVEEFFELKGASENEMKNILNSVGLKEDILKRKIGDLSSGQFQRILIGWALVSNPQVLLFDEPTTGIDLGGQESIYQLLEKMKQEKNLTILLVTHDLSVVYHFTTHCLCLNKKMLCYSVPRELTNEQLSRLYGGEIKFHQHSHD